MSNRGIILAKSQPLTVKADRQLLSNVSSPFGININRVREEILTLSKFETKCLLIQLGQLESNTNSDLISVGVPTVGTYAANINANTVIAYDGSYFANISAVVITNSDHSDIKLGMVANVVNGSSGSFGSNTTVIQKSVGGNITAGNFVPGFTYTVTSIGTTDFSECGVIGGAVNVTIGNVFVANAAGSGSGTAFLSNNQILLGSNHTVSGDIRFNVSPLKLGKYQATQWLLTKYGYLTDDGEWKTKDGIDSHEVFLSAARVQDKIMEKFISEEYVNLIKTRAIREGDSKDIIAGMLALAYQYQDLGNPILKESAYNTDGTINLENYSIATKSNVWRETGQTLDSQKRPGHIYFNSGRYAIVNLGADIEE